MPGKFAGSHSRLRWHNMPPYICNLNVTDGFTDTRNTCHRLLCAILVLPKKRFVLRMFFCIDGIRINFSGCHQSVPPIYVCCLQSRSGLCRTSDRVGRRPRHSPTMSHNCSCNFGFTVHRHRAWNQHDHLQTVSSFLSYGIPWSGHRNKTNGLQDFHYSTCLLCIHPRYEWSSKSLESHDQNNKGRGNVNCAAQKQTSFWPSRQLHIRRTRPWSSKNNSEKVVKSLVFNPPACRRVLWILLVRSCTVCFVFIFV